MDGDGNVDRSIQYLTTYGKEGDGYIINGVEEPRFFLSRSPNVNITWEVGTTYNAGLDFKFFNNRLTWESDIFYQKRTHMLISRNASIPEILGITLPRENLGEMENKGFESLIGWNDRAGDFTYNISLNTTYAQNKILFWDETPGVPEYQQSTGHRANTNLYYVAEGIYHTQEEIDNSTHWSGAVPGDVRYKDVNGDGKIDADDRVRSKKNAEPPFVGGLNLQLSWKNWDIMVLFQGAVGAEAFIRTWSGTVGNFLTTLDGRRRIPTPTGRAPTNARTSIGQTQATRAPSSSRRQTISD